MAIAPSDDGFQQISFVNSIATSKGGTHVQHVADQVVDKLLEFVKKKHKGMEKVLKDHFEGDAPGAGAEAAAAAAEEEEEVIVHFAWEAAQLGDDAALEELLAQEADKDAADEEGRSGLHFACGYGELACAKILLQAGAKVDTVDTNKNSPLHYAAGYGQLEAAELLVKHEADRGLKNADGHTAYEIAKMNNQDAIMKVLG